jgi:hypothetical protein
MIRSLPFVLLFFYSCSSLPLYNDVLSYAKIAFSTVDYPSTEIINASPYALMGVELGKTKAALVLAYDRDDYLEWVSASNESIITFGGKLIQSAGLQNDVRIINPPDIEKITKNYVEQGTQIEWQSFLSLSEPILDMTPIIYSYKIDDVIYSQEDSTLESKMVTEFFDSPAIRWSGKNIYWYDLEGQFLASKQEIYPGTHIRLEILKPYKR